LKLTQNDIWPQCPSEHRWSSTSALFCRYCRVFECSW
jgi:hypothetical protein